MKCPMQGPCIVIDVAYVFDVNFFNNAAILGFDYMYLLTNLQLNLYLFVLLKAFEAFTIFHIAGTCDHYKYIQACSSYFGNCNYLCWDCWFRN